MNIGCKPVAESGNLLYRLPQPYEVALAVTKPDTAFAHTLARIVARDFHYRVLTFEAG